MRLIKLLLLVLAVLVAAVIVVPLIVLAGLFVWLKVTEEADDEALDIEPEMDTAEDSGAV
jgi:hypothetical protein